MPKALPHIQTFHVGYCTAPSIMSRRDGKFRKQKFPAGVALIRHADLGDVLFDTGYGASFWQATQSFPEVFYRWLTPAYLDRPITEHLSKTPDMVIFSHLHADHVAGFFDMPQVSKIMASTAALEGLRFGRLKSLRAGCPQDLRDRLLGLTIDPLDHLPQIDHDLEGFSKGYDIAGDGQMIAIPLSGHGIGQMGLYLPQAEFDGTSAPVFLVADAIWSLCALRENAPPPDITLRKLGNARAYLKGFYALRELHHARPDIRIIASHCTEAYPLEGMQ